MSNYHYVFSSWNHCAVAISQMFDILFIRSRRLDIFEKDWIENESWFIKEEKEDLKYLA